MSEEDDPFAHLDDAAGDREGDPFDHLADESTDDYDAHDVTPGDHRDELFAADHDSETPGGTDAGDAAFDEGANSPEEHHEGTDFEYQDAPGVRTEEGPGDVTDEVFAQGEVPQDDPFGEGGVFEEMDVAEVDPDRVWEQLTDAQARGSVSETRERTYAEVSKHSYCEQCEFFSAPPDVACSHEGTEIVEFVDMETVRVLDCPVVAEREKLEQE